ncbi:hypothetical protein UT300012_24580 [Paraclostridium bifermentans]
MKENLQNLNNCPKDGVAVKEVNVSSKDSRIRRIQKDMNEMLLDNREGRFDNGAPTVNRTEATKALYKIADEIVKWGQSVYPHTKDVAKMKPRTAKELWKDVCVIKGYEVDSNIVDALNELYDRYTLSEGLWEEVSVAQAKDNLIGLFHSKGIDLDMNNILDLFSAFGRLSASKGLCTHSEWLAKAYAYTCMQPDDCLGEGIAGLVEPLLRYKFSMGSIIERELVVKLNRTFRKREGIKNVNLIDTVFEINKKSNRLLHIQPSSRDLHEVYVMPYMEKDGTYSLEYLSLSTLQGYVEQGETLAEYKKVCVNKGTIPESTMIELMVGININRIALNLDPIVMVTGGDVKSGKPVIYKGSLNVSEALDECKEETLRIHEEYVKSGMSISSIASNVESGREGKRYVVFIREWSDINDTTSLDTICRLGKNYGRELALVGKNIVTERIYRNIYGLGYKKSFSTLQEMKDKKAITSELYEELNFRLNYNIKPCSEEEYDYVQTYIVKDLNRKYWDSWR